MDEFLKATYYINIDSKQLQAYARKYTGHGPDDIRNAISLYYTVRDQFVYNPWCLSMDKPSYMATATLTQREGFCIQKAILYAALCRIIGIPARLGYANVRNHLTSERIKAAMKTDVFVFHGYVEVFLNGKWVKATPAFNKELCEKNGIHPLEFDGVNDSIFHPFDAKGKKHMEYLHDYGTFNDFPFEMMVEEFKKYYPHWFDGSMQIK